MNVDLTDRRALVAGSSAGLGFAADSALTREGAEVAISGRHSGRLSAAADALRCEGASVVTIFADGSSTERASAMVDRSSGLLGGLDILVASAGGPPPGTFASISLDDSRIVLYLNPLATVAMGRQSTLSTTDARPPIRVWWSTPSGIQNSSWSFGNYRLRRGDLSLEVGSSGTTNTRASLRVASHWTRNSRVPW